jgi:ubiquinone/menaquinone biosynthesis C-methylase UbiE
MVAERLTSGRVIGVDVSREMLDELRRNAARRGLQARVEALEGDAMALSLDDASADRAITVAAWHHLDAPQRACDELARVLRPGGRLVAVDLEISHRHRPGDHLHGHDRHFDESEMKRVLTTAGLQDIRVETTGRWILATAVKPS